MSNESLKDTLQVIDVNKKAMLSQGNRAMPL